MNQLLPTDFAEEPKILTKKTKFDMKKNVKKSTE